MKLFSNLDQHLIFSRKAEGTGLSNVWVAWDADPSQRARVSWVLDKSSNSYLWIKVDAKGDIVFEDGKAKHWTGSSWELVTLQP